MKIEPKIIEHTKSVLKQFGNRYISDTGTVKKNKVINDLNNYDKELISALLNDDFITKNYTETVNSSTIFKLNQFNSMFEYKDFWEDSFTKYSNKIGLVSNDKFIDESTDVVLDYPYKDTVLKAGMTKEDANITTETDEPFLNETIAYSEINELFEPKVMVGATKYNKDGSTKNFNFTDKDNLIIKGNNLIALHSLVKQYSGKVKSIYLDPPFNTGNDSFLYNDKFNHSSWLTFMKNRLEIAKELLSDDGMIFVQLDYNEEAYLKVLMDGIFGREQYVSTIVVKSNSISGTKTRNKDKTILKNKDSIIVFAKNSNNLTINAQYEEKSKWDTHYNQYLSGDMEHGFSTSKLKDELIKHGIIQKDESIKPDIWNNKQFRNFAVNNANKIFRIVNSIPESLKKKSLQNRGHVVYESDNKGNKMFALNGKRLSMLSRTFHKVKNKNVPAQLLGDLWTDIDFQNTQNQGGVKFTNAKKPEQLLSRIIDMSTNSGDIVLDFFMGSATTQAVAMKMHRQFIGIEQMDYINTISIPRLQKVIAGEQGGISKDVNWQGGGSFVYAELMQKNQGYLKDLSAASNTDELELIFQRMKQGADFDFRVDLEKYENDKERTQLSFDDQKKLLIKMLDKNQLYYNEANIDDANIRDLISDSDYEFNKSFYGNRRESN